MKKLLIALSLVIVCSQVYATPSYADVSKALEQRNCTYARELMDNILVVRPESDRAKQLDTEVVMACQEPAKVVATQTAPVKEYPQMPFPKKVLLALLAVAFLVTFVVATTRHWNKPLDKNKVMPHNDTPEPSNYVEHLTVHDVNGNK